MTTKKKRISTALGLALLAVIYSGAAQAYVGPGAGLGVIGTLIAFIGTVLLAIVGFVWYPIKRVLRKKRQADPHHREQAPVQEEVTQEQGAEG